MQLSTGEILSCKIDSKQISMTSEGTENSFTHPSEEKIVQQMHSSDEKDAREFFEQNRKPRKMPE